MAYQYRDLYQDVTNSIVAELESGAVPWLKPWASNNSGNGIAPQMPCNAISSRSYSGVNVLILWSACMARGYPSGRWLTYKQAQGLGGNVRKGEHGTTIVFMKRFTKTARDTAGNESENTFPVLRAYTVFNVAQCENLPERLADVAPVPVTSDVTAFVAAARADVRHGGDRAFYTTAGDYIQMPVPQAFSDVAQYEATLLHESIHWSGADKRLNREFGKRFGDNAYAVEELVAEIGAAFLCAQLGIKGDLRHAGYLESWLKVLKADKRAIFTAASQASKAAEYLTAFSGTAESNDNEDSDETETAQAASPGKRPDLSRPRFRFAHRRAFVRQCDPLNYFLIF